MWKRTWLFKVPLCENYEIQVSYLQGPCVVQIITTTYWELCTTGITFVGFSPCGYRQVSSNYHLLRIVHHRYHICRVLPCVDTDMFLQTTTYWELCTTGITFVGFLPCVDHGHVSSNYHLLRIVHHRYHICRVSPQCGYGHVSSNYYFVRIVHHRNHICMVYAECGYGHVSSNYSFRRIVHHRYHICMVYAQCGYGHVS